MAKALEVELVPAQLRHVHMVAARMRAEDRAEVLASGLYRPAQALRASLRASEFARTAFIGREVLAMLGVAKADDVVAVPWMLTTDAVEQHPMAFWRACKAGLAQMRELYPVMAQAIDARHGRALSWAKRLGFIVGDAAPFGRAGLQFHPIAMLGDA